MLAVMRRELSSYFHSLVGPVFLAAFYVLAGFYFTITSLRLFTSDMSQMFGSLFAVVLFLIPILTMRLLSEERRHKTDQALLTAPLTLTGLVIGKYLSAVILYLIGLAITLVYAVFCSFVSEFDWALFFGNFTALLLLGMALIAIGLFISSLTESQVIAAIGTFAAILLLLLIDAMRPVLQAGFLQDLVAAVSIYDRYSVFTVGIFDFSNIDPRQFL